MNVKQQREARKTQAANIDRFDFKDELEHYSMLHSGFTEQSSTDSDRNAFWLSIWFSNGAYQAKLVDREAGDQTFLEAGRLVDVFSKLEEGLHDLSLVWKKIPEKNGRGWHGASS